MRRLPLLTLGSLAVILLVGCADDETPVRADGSDGPVAEHSGGAAVEYRGSGTVLESAKHGPELCDGVQLSLPPQCDGVPLVGWDWGAVEGELSLNGTTSGSWEVTGTWDGEALTLTERPGPPRERNEEKTDLRSPCKEPAGGWAPIDASLVSVEAQEHAMRVANQLPDVAGTWVDQSINPALEDGYDPGDEEVANDPALLVVNVQVTDDPAGAETAIREVWGGALCVSTAKHTMAELDAIQRQLFDDYGAAPAGVSSGGVDVSRNQVVVTAYVATPELRTEVERRFGDAVALTGLLEPID